MMSLFPDDAIDRLSNLGEEVMHEEVEEDFVEEPGECAEDGSQLYCTPQGKKGKAFRRKTLTKECAGCDCSSDTCTWGQVGLRGILCIRCVMLALWRFPWLRPTDHAEYLANPSNK